jgi:hypothetical protein
MKRLFIALVGLVVFSISAYGAQGASPAAKKDELPKMTMTMCDKMGTADCAMAKTAPVASGSAMAQMPANCPMGNAGAPGQCQMQANCPMGSSAAPGQCQMGDMKCQTNCAMQSFVDILKLQEKVIAGVRAPEKKKLIAEIDRKIAEMESMIGKMQKGPAMQMPCKSPMPCVQPGAPAAPQAPAK